MGVCGEMDKPKLPTSTALRHTLGRMYGDSKMDKLKTPFSGNDPLKQKSRPARTALLTTSQPINNRLYHNQNVSECVRVCQSVSECVNFSPLRDSHARADALYADAIHVVETLSNDAMCR